MPDLAPPEAAATLLSKTSVPPDSVNAPKRVYVKSFGCQMNVYDSQRIADLATAEGYSETSVIEDADLIVLNTCHIREKAGDKLYSELGRVREIKAARNAKLVVAGCVAQAEGREIMRRQPAVDIVVGPQNYHHLPDLLRAGVSAVDTDFPLDDKFDYLPAPTRKAVLARGVSAFVTVQEGCDKFCSFCVVPYTRGSETSRPVSKIVAEIAGLARAGARDFTLIGQNVNGYHGEDAKGRPASLADPARRGRPRIPGVLRLRYSTSHPNDMERRSDRRPCRQSRRSRPICTLPVQSGSDRILAAMNRRHDVAAVPRHHRAGAAKRGPTSRFPPTSSSAFPARRRPISRRRWTLVREVGFASAFAFKYSSRPGTPGRRRARSGPPSRQSRAAAERLQRAARKRNGRRSTSATVGRRFGVIFDKPGRHPGQFVGPHPLYAGRSRRGSRPERVGEMTRSRDLTGREAELVTAALVVARPLRP